MTIFTSFLSNHLSANTKAMQDVCATLGELKGAIQSCHDKSHHP
jgi:hypothetical protein